MGLYSIMVLFLMANGLAQYSLGHRPRKMENVPFLANGHIQSSSVPNVLFIEFDAIPIQKFAVFVLKRLGAVMFFLRFDVLQHVFAMRWTDGEDHSHVANRTCPGRVVVF